MRRIMPGSNCGLRPEHEFPPVPLAFRVMSAERSAVGTAAAPAHFL